MTETENTEPEPMPEPEPAPEPTFGDEGAGPEEEAEPNGAL
jgi:hypothetical protein